MMLKGEKCSLEYTRCIRNPVLIHKTNWCLEEYTKCCRTNKNERREMGMAW